MIEKIQYIILSVGPENLRIVKTPVEKTVGVKQINSLISKLYKKINMQLLYVVNNYLTSKY